MPIQSQPQGQNGDTTYLEQFTKPKAVVPTGLECLVEVEDVILQSKIFQTRNGQTLFGVRREYECCGPSFNVRLRDPYQRDVVSLYQESSGCCGGENRLIISSPPSEAIGFVTAVSSSSKLNVSIQMGRTLHMFRAEMPLSLTDNSTIEIISEEGSHPVAHIIKENEAVLFHFPMDMEATLKALILGAFLYMSFRLQEVTRSYNYSSSDEGWATAGGMDLYIDHHHHDDHHHHHDYHHHDHHDHHDASHGGDCGGGWGGDGGDCGGGDGGGGD